MSSSRVNQNSIRGSNGVIRLIKFELIASYASGLNQRSMKMQILRISIREEIRNILAGISIIRDEALRLPLQR